MTLRDIINDLEDIAAEHGDDIEVRQAHQPAWAFEYSIATVGVARVQGNEDRQPKTVAYIAEGQQLGYLPGKAANAIGWGRGDETDNGFDDDGDDEDDGE